MNHIELKYPLYRRLREQLHIEYFSSTDNFKQWLASQGAKLRIAHYRKDLTEVDINAAAVEIIESTKYYIEFDDPADQIMFVMKWL